MTLEQVENQALLMYQENLLYLKQVDSTLYEKLSLFDIALNENQINPKYELQYKEGYFDLLDLSDGSFFYKIDSVFYGQDIVNNLNFDVSSQSFKTYSDLKYTNEFIKEVENYSIESSSEIGIAPIVHYVNNNLPEKEKLKEIYKFIIFGVGLGTHIPRSHDKIKAKLYLIIEPNLEIFRLSLFVTNYALLSTKTSLLFSIAENEDEFKKKFDFFYQEFFIVNHYLKFLMFSNNCFMYTRIIQNYLVSQPHTMYSFNRYFQSFRRTKFFIREKFPVLNLSKNHKLRFMNKPILFLGAGPSLQNEIEFVKENQNKFVIVAIYATIVLLEKNQIVPDIVTQYDEQDGIVMSTVNKVKNLNFFSNTIFIFASHIDEKLMNIFPSQNIFIFQALFELKKDFGILTSPSIGEITYALSLILGAEEIYMLGIDMALDVKTGNTHIEGHSGAGGFKLKTEEESDDKEYLFRRNIIKIKGNLLNEVNTAPVFKTLLDYFNEMTKRFNNNCKVYNFSSNGAYFNETIPLRIKDFNVDFLKEIDKKTLKEEIFFELNSISSIDFSLIDMVLLNDKLQDAKKIKKILEDFHMIKKYVDIDKYKNNLLKLLKNILYSSYSCVDLQKIIHNYVSFTVHYIWHILSVQSITNQKKHIKQLNKYFYEKVSLIINSYINILER